MTNTTTTHEEILRHNEIPSGHGLLILLKTTTTSSLREEETNEVESTAVIHIESVPDEHYEYIHPNCYGPKSLQNVTLLHGGGSGTAVFSGVTNYDQQQQQQIVMKHGGCKDTKEVFGLVHVNNELIKYCNNSNNRYGDTVVAAAKRMQKRIPQFRMVYISPNHLGPRTTSTTSKQRQQQARSIVYTESSNFMNEHWSIDEETGTLRIYVPPLVDGLNVVRRCSTASNDFVVQVLHTFRNELLHQQCCHHNNWKVTIGQSQIGDSSVVENGATVLTTGRLHGDVLETLLSEFIQIVNDLQQLTTANTNRHNSTQYEQVYAEVVELQKQNQQHQPADIRSVSDTANAFVGYAIHKNFHDTTGRFRMLRDISVERMKCNAMICWLTQQEQIPAEFLRKLFHTSDNDNTSSSSNDCYYYQNNCCLLSDVFIDNPTTTEGPWVSALVRIEQHGGWWDVLQRAVGVFDATTTTPSECTDSIWICGLTDAGLHNTFLQTSEEEQQQQQPKLFLFDLGDDASQPLPAFLTKFLMSFWHTLGMVDDGDGAWVQRFTIVVTDGNTKYDDHCDSTSTATCSSSYNSNNRKLALTEDTKIAIQQIHSTFQIVLDRILTELFHCCSSETTTATATSNDSNNNCQQHTASSTTMSIRKTLITYVVIQLLSDASFCLIRWKTKGGGSTSRFHGRDSKSPLQKWLWRCLWDQYIASYVYEHFYES